MRSTIHFFFTLIFLSVTFFSLTVSAQMNNGHGTNTQSPQGIITGNVIDKKTGAPIEYANVVIYKTKDSTMVNGVVTDQKGVFRIDKVPYGNYYIKINFIGYKPGMISNVMIKPDAPIRKISDVSLEVTSTMIEGATITGEKEQMEFNLDKKVVNVDKNLSLAGGTAVDVMQTIPSVTVDVEGTVSLRGSSNVTILVDGRPSAYTSLDQLPASMIERVEIVTNPSARYDPDGMSGIINIVLKKKKEPGYNGLISLNAGTHDKYMGSINLNYRYNKINVFTNYDLRYFSMNSTTENHRESWFNDTSSYLDQYNLSRNHGQFHNLKAGIDYFVNDFNTLSLSGSYHTRAFLSSDLYKNTSTDYAHALTNYYERFSDGKNATDGYEMNVNYKKTFTQKNREWTIDGSFEKHNVESDQDMRLQPYDLNMFAIDQTSFQNSLTLNDNYEGEIRTDYVQPIGKGRMEAGYKYNFDHNNQDYSLNDLDSMQVNWIKDTNTSNQFIYNEQIHAAYLIYSNSVKKFQYQAGLRVEEFIADGNQVTQKSTFSKSRFGWFPTVHLKYEFNDHNSLQLSYSRRVRRPRLGQLNPFTNYSDPLNLSTGNPYLEPEYTNSCELGYDFNYKNTSITTSVFYRLTTGMMSRFTTLDTNGISHTTYENLNNGTSYGIELIIAQKLFKWWKVNASGSYFRQEYEGDNVSTEAQNSNSWTSKINSSWTPVKGFDIQASFFYNSPVVTAAGGGRFMSGASGQGKMDENYWADLGIKKDFFKGALSVSLRVSDMFKTQKYDSWSWGENYATTTERNRDSRVIFLGATYKINGGVKKRRSENGGDEDIEF